MLIVRELCLGPLRFRELARAVGGAPTDVLSRRLADLEQEGILRRRELESPTLATVYELTDVGRGLERPMLELGRWGLNFQHASDVADLEPSSLPNALRVILHPPADATFSLGLVSEGQAFTLRMKDGWIDASRGESPDVDLRISGTPIDVVGALVVGEDGEDVEIDGDRSTLEALRSMVVIPERLRDEALAEAASRVATTAA